MRRGEGLFLALAVLLLCALSVAGLAAGYPAAAMVFPVAVTGFMILFVAMRVLEARKAVAGTGRHSATEGEETDTLRQALPSFLWVAAVILVLAVFGYQLGLPLYVLAFLLSHRVSPATAVAIAAGTGAFIYLVFAVLLQVFLPTGLVGGFLG